MRGSVRLGRIAGINIDINYTWLLAFILIAWSLAAGAFPTVIPRQSASTYWVMGILASLMLFVSVLLHELAHSLVARSRGLGVSSITLFIFGGVSNLEQEPQSARTEFYMAFVGPFCSLVLGFIFWGIALYSGVIGNPLQWFLMVLPQATPLAAILAYLSSINIVLAIFNLLPGFPLDGGRVLRSIIWGISGNLASATRAASGVGRVLAWALIGYGVFELLTGNFLGGLWIAFIGWFLANASDASQREVTLEQQLKGVRVKDVMDASPESVNPHTMVAELVRDVFLQKGRRAAAVSEEGRVLGVVTLNDVKHLPQPKWPETPVSAIMTREPLHTVNVDDDLSAAFRLLAQYSLNQVLVLREGKLAGWLSRADLIRYLQLSQELGLRSK